MTRIIVKQQLKDSQPFYIKAIKFRFQWAYSLQSLCFRFSTKWN